MHLYEISGECGGILLRGDRIMRGTRSRSYLSECKWQLDRNYVCWRARRRRESVDQEGRRSNQNASDEPKSCHEPTWRHCEKSDSGSATQEQAHTPCPESTNNSKERKISTENRWLIEFSTSSIYVLHQLCFYIPSIHPSIHPSQKKSFLINSDNWRQRQLIEQGSWTVDCPSDPFNLI